MYLRSIAIKSGIIIIKEIKLLISLRLIKELDINIKIKELEFLNNRKL